MHMLKKGLAMIGKRTFSRFLSSSSRSFLSRATTLLAAAVADGKPSSPWTAHDDTAEASRSSIWATMRRSAASSRDRTASIRPSTPWRPRPS